MNWNINHDKKRDNAKLNLNISEEESDKLIKIYLNWTRQLNQNALTDDMIKFIHAIIFSKFATFFKNIHSVILMSINLNHANNLIDINANQKWLK